MTKPIMNILICGKSFIGCWAIQYLTDYRKVAGPLTISVLPNHDDTGKDTWQPSLIKCAKSLHVPVVRSIQERKTAQTGVILSLEYDKIIRMSEVKSWRAYNIHFSALPKYRGCLTSAWPLRNGEKESGVTLHEITSRIDSGPIVDQIQFPIGPYITSEDLYHLYQHNGFELFKRNIMILLSDKKVSARVQSERGASYYRRSSIDFRNRTIRNFALPATTVANYVRSLIFKPYQLPVFHNKKIVFCDVLTAQKGVFKGKVGHVVLDDKNHAVVVCQDGNVRMFFA